MRIAVIGVGGVGGLFGGKLAQAGHDVFFFARGSHFDELQNRGLILEDPNGNREEIPVNLATDPANVGPVDVILLGVKAWQVKEAAQNLKPLLGENTFVVPLQNGVDAPSILANELGKNHVFGGLCYVVSMIKAPGVIKHIAIEPLIIFGELDNSLSNRALDLMYAFKKAGVNAEIQKDIHTAMWEKFLFIAPMSGVGAITRAPIGITRKLPETRNILIEAASEIFNVAGAKAILLPSDAIERMMAKIDAVHESTTASMQRDIMEGKPSELDFQSGAVARIKTEVNVKTPINSIIYKALLPQELKARGKLHY